MNGVKMDIQSIPNPDSPNNDAFEAIVELYYQSKGYITSSGKWFWVYGERKKQRGYQDIDVLAIKASEVLIVSVTSNLDDKIRIGRDGKVRQEMLEKLKTYFERVRRYFNAVEDYKWLVADGMQVKHIIAYNHAFDNAAALIQPVLNDNGIESISARVMLESLVDYVKQPNLRIQNQMLRTIQLLEFNGQLKSESPKKGGGP